MAVLLWCTRCGAETVIVGEVPILCESCRAVTTFTAKKPYTVTANDQKFLRSIKISHGKTD